MRHPRELKAELRDRALERRAALSAEEHAEGSERAVERIRPLLRPGETVALFWPIKGEIDPLPLIADIIRHEGAVAMPAVTGNGLAFRRFTDPGELEHGPFGTRHPPDRAERLRPDLVVTPLAAFDRRGGRIGYGAGYYDQALAALIADGRPLRAIGIAFACQEVDEVPMEPHDVPLLAIATETKLFETEEMA